MLLDARVAVVTGGGRGIGRAIARRLASEGAAVVIAARTDAEIEAVAKEIRDTGGRASAVRTDVADEPQCGHLVRTTEAQYGRIDILSTMPGIMGPSSLWRKFFPRNGIA